MIPGLSVLAYHGFFFLFGLEVFGVVGKLSNSEIGDGLLRVGVVAGITTATVDVDATEVFAKSNDLELSVSVLIWPLIECQLCVKGYWTWPRNVTIWIRLLTIRQHKCRCS